jgi:ABC-2 type transport system permease protein
VIYNGFEAISRITGLGGGTDYIVAMLGIDFHYRSISRGVIDTRDLVYFLSIIGFFLVFTNRNLVKRYS